MPALESILPTAGNVLRNIGGAYTEDTPTNIVQAAVQNINAQTGTSYTLALTDANKIVTCTNGSAIVLTIPTNATAAIPIGSTVRVIQGGAGQVTVTAAGGATVNVAATFTLKLLQQHAEVALTKLATNTWLLTGVLEAV